MRRLISAITVSIATLLMMPVAAFAHVVVTPKQAGIGAELVFTVSVPNEQSTNVTMVKVAIPKGVIGVTPTSIPGWTITTDDTGDDISAITWSGTIPVGQRADFSFGAQVPATATQLDWKAYQTYADGTVVHWDQTPAGSDDATGNAGPYSVTNVVNDLTTTPASSSTNNDSSLPILAIVLSGFAVIISLIGIISRKRK